MIELAMDLKELRESTGMTTKKFCYTLGINTRTLYYWEMGEREMPVRRMALYASTCRVGIQDVYNAISETVLRGGE